MTTIVVGLGAMGGRIAGRLLAGDSSGAAPLGRRRRARTSRCRPSLPSTTVADQMLSTSRLAGYGLYGAIYHRVLHGHAH